jgi:hypothetical protein
VPQRLRRFDGCGDATSCRCPSRRRHLHHPFAVPRSSAASLCPWPPRRAAFPAAAVLASPYIGHAAAASRRRRGAAPPARGPSSSAGSRRKDVALVRLGNGRRGAGAGAMWRHACSSLAGAAHAPRARVGAVHAAQPRVRRRKPQPHHATRCAVPCWRAIAGACMHMAHELAQASATSAAATGLGLLRRRSCDRREGRRCQRRKRAMHEGKRDSRHGASPAQAKPAQPARADVWGEGSERAGGAEQAEGRRAGRRSAAGTTPAARATAALHQPSAWRQAEAGRAAAAACVAAVQRCRGPQPTAPTHPRPPAQLRQKEARRRNGPRLQRRALCEQGLQRSTAAAAAHHSAVLPAWE